MPQSAELGLVVTGQGTSIAPEWVDAPGIRNFVEPLSAVLPHTDIFKQIQTVRENPPDTALETHTLLTGIITYALDRLKRHKDAFAATTGHSLGLIFSPYPFGFYGEDTRLLAKVAYERGRLLTEAQENSQTKGAMYTVHLTGEHSGFSFVENLLAQEKNIWIACYNVDGPKGTFVTLTAREDVDVAAIFQGITVPERTKIATPAHSPLVEGKARQFTEFLSRHSGFHDLPAEGTLFVSDHHAPDADKLTVTHNRDEIVSALGSLREPVRFQEAVTSMIHDSGVRKIILVGSRSLESLIKRMPDAPDVFSVHTPADLDKLETELSNIQEV